MKPKPVRLAWWLWAAAIVLAIGLAMLAGRLAQAQGRLQPEPLPVRCEGDQCVISKALLLELVRDAGLAVKYAQMCNWTKD